MKRFVYIFLIVIAVGSVLFSAYSSYRYGMLLDSMSLSGSAYPLSLYGDLLWALLGFSLLSSAVAFILRAHSRKRFAFITAIVLSVALISMLVVTVINTPDWENMPRISEGTITYFVEVSWGDGLKWRMVLRNWFM